MAHCSLRAPHTWHTSAASDVCAPQAWQALVFSCGLTPLPSDVASTHARTCATARLFNSHCCCESSVILQHHGKHHPERQCTGEWALWLDIVAAHRHVQLHEHRAHLLQRGARQVVLLRQVEVRWHVRACKSCVGHGLAVVLAVHRLRHVQEAAQQREGGAQPPGVPACGACRRLKLLGMPC